MVGIKDKLTKIRSTHIYTSSWGLIYTNLAKQVNKRVQYISKITSFWYISESG
jgi:hypothetical protein